MTTVPLVCNRCGFWLALDGTLRRSSEAKTYPCEPCLHDAYYRQNPKEPK